MMKTKLKWIFLISLILPGINEHIWDKSGVEFWINWGILFLIAFSLLTLLLTIDEKIK